MNVPLFKFQFELENVSSAVYECVHSVGSCIKFEIKLYWQKKLRAAHNGVSEITLPRNMPIIGSFFDKRDDL